MAEIINTIPLDPTTFEFQEYSLSDTSLITSVEIENSFNPSIDYIEYFVYDLNGNIAYENITGYPGYKLIDNVLTLSPDVDLTTLGFTEGQYNTLYNFLSPKLSSNSTNTYYISEISADRTEIRLDTTVIPNEFVISSSIELTNDIVNATGSYYDFYLNFGENQLAIANNILLDTSSINNPTVLIKLYEALPQQFDINSQCWVVTQVANPVAYNISITQTFDVTDENIYLRGPNTNISIKDQINNSTDYNNSSQLSLTDSTQGSGSLRYQLNSMLADTGIEINVDYSNYDNFIHFSSAQTRLENFYYKLSLIEQYNYSASYSDSTTTNYYVSSSNVVWQSKINEIITGFDNYEYFLYFNSGSASWPKTGDTPPYTNYSSTSIEGQAWFASQTLVAEEYDIENNNALINAIPSYLLEDPENYQYELFIEMIGQHFDNIFLYTQDITNKYNADNRLNYGVSKDLVADILRDMGIKIYQNNFSTNDLYSALLGLTPSGSLYNLPYTTGSLPTPAGFEYINTYITASNTSSLTPSEDINAEVYKRIYSNLPYLLKKKGTVEGLKALITIYGIPDTILQVNEYGGQNKIIENDYDLWFNQYDYAFDTQGSNYVSSSFELENEWGVAVPSTLQFRFQTRGIPTDEGYYSQSLWTNDSGAALRLLYTGSGYTSGSYSGSIVNSYNEYACLDFIPDTSSPSTSASVYLPVFDGDWWNVMITEDSGEFTLYAGNKTTPGGNYNTYQFLESASINGNATPWNNGTLSYFSATSNTSLGKIFSGSYQEIRYYNEVITVDPFEDYIMYPYSIDSNGINTAPITLAFRATLGGELYTSSISVHPKITGSWATTESFQGGVSTFDFLNTPVFVSNEEFVYPNQFPAGIKNRVSNKIRQENIVLPYSGSEEVNLPTNQVLSPFISIQQNVPQSGSFTPNIDYVEVAFSPQNEINNDIAGQLGYFNIGEYIGDPRLVPTKDESYPALDVIRDYYFEKYTSNYNIWDYIRLIKYFDNSLFKMILDWVPARTDLSSGIVIKQTTLERNKYPVPQLNTETTSSYQFQNQPFVFQNLEITGSSIQMYTITGSNGGSMPNLEGEVSGSGPGFNISPITQSWTGSTPSLLGPVGFTESSQTEFFDGELSGSNILVTNGELNTGCDPLKTPDTTIITYDLSGSFSSSFSEFNAEANAQTDNGEIKIWFDRTRVPNSPNDVAGSTYYYRITALSIAKESLNGLNLDNYIPQALEIILNANYITANFTLTGWSNSFPYTGTTIAPSWVGNPNPTLVIDNIQERTSLSGDGYYLLQCVPNQNSYFKIYTDYTGIGTVSVTPKSSVLTILEPFVLASFNTSDCNVLAGNAIADRPNDEFYDVDFNTNQITAVNQQNIIAATQGTGTATPSTVPASNYTTARIAIPRYIGRELSSARLNEWTEGDIAYGKTSNVGNPEVNFVYFNYAGGTSPEWGNQNVNQTQLNVRYIIDQNGNATKPINDANGINLGTIQQTFDETLKATLLLDDNDTFGVNLASLNGTWPIFKSGYKIAPIIYTQTASYDNSGNIVDYGYTGSIDFTFGGAQSSALTPDYRLTAFPTTSQLLTSSQSFPQVIAFNNTPTILGESGSFSSNIYSPITTDPSGSTTLYFTGTFRTLYTQVPVIVTYALQKNGITVQTTQVNYQSDLEGSLSYVDISAKTTDQYRLVALTFDDIYPDYPEELILDTQITSFNITQTPSISGGTCTSFWGTSPSRTLVVALGGLTGLNNFYGQTQTNINRSGFNDITLPFTVQIGDEIRFEGTETLAYSITSVSQNASGNIILNLNGTIPIGTNLDYFLIRRYVADPSNIILNINKPAGASSGGILKPQYLSPGLEDNVDSIIQNLRDKNLI